ncbi:MAG: hypothetical protein JWQ72_1983 [Polaromonas sp.]|nr:hypothetical protein [Polaromonas sp.]
MQALLSASLHLPDGACFTARLQAGSLVVALAGTLHLSAAPQWLAGQLLQPRLQLHEGESHEVPESGWVTLHAAAGGADILVHRAPRPRGAWQALLQQIAQAVHAWYRASRRVAARGSSA